MDSLNQKSNLQPLSRNPCIHSLSDGCRKIAFGRGVDICFKRETDSSSITQFLNKNHLHERIDPRVGLKPLGQGAFGMVTVVCQDESDDSLCVVKTTKGMGAPKVPDRRELYNEVENKLSKKVEENLGDTELNAFMLPAHESICRSYCALIKYDYDKTWKLITSKSDIDESKGKYTVKAILEESCSGTELQDQLSSRGKVSSQPMSREIIYDITLKAMKALDCIHQSKLVYRDLKPANILYNPVTGELKIIDFGLTRAISDKIEWINGPVGTPGFIAPEEYGRREVSSQGDDWSLGAMLLSILCDGERPAVLMAKMTGVSQPSCLSDYKKIACLFSKLADDCKREKINQEIEKRNGKRKDYSELVDIIVGLTRMSRADRMSTKSAMDKFQKLFDQGKVGHPGPLSEDAFNGVEHFEEFSQEEIDEMVCTDIPLCTPATPAARKGWQGKNMITN